MPHRESPPGFRFFPTDAVVLVVGTAAPLAAWWLLGRDAAPFAGLALLATWHFFLFCNVIRAPRNLELIWAAIFCANAALWLAVLEFRWLGFLGIQLAATAWVAWRTVRHPKYRGVGAGRRLTNS